MRRESLDELVEVAKRAVTWVLTPEAVCITAATLQPKEMQIKFGRLGLKRSLYSLAQLGTASGFDIVSEYFEKQRRGAL